MTDPITRTEKVHINERSRQARSTGQWFLENRTATHPVTHNNELTIFICGEKAFEDIAKHIRTAKHSIDIICWGFDPGMEFVRTGSTWPRGETYGDLLIAAGKRGVKVRLLVWYSSLVGGSTQNMPGHTHGTNPWRVVAVGSNEAGKISAQRSLSLLKEHYYKSAAGRNLMFNGASGWRRATSDDLPLLAREEYCNSWYKAAFAGLLENVHVRTRAGDPGSIEKSLASEKHQPGGLGELEVERAGMVKVGTHHQKTILIDYNRMDDGSRAVGYVKGLNSVTDYWDTEAHLIEDPRRETGCAREAGEIVQVEKNQSVYIGFETFKPYRDYACRIDSGGALTSVYANFARAWERIGYDFDDPNYIPSAIKNKVRQASHSSVQIVRTQPQEQDKTIKEMYFLATDQAALASGYLYVENQYFQYQEWSERLVQARKNVISAWKAGAAKAGKSKADMPLMHVFIVIPVPERQQMVPRTYDTLAVLGQQSTMAGQSEFIDSENKKPATLVMHDEFGQPISLGRAKPAVVEYANRIDKPSIDALEKQYGLKVAVSMLQTSGRSYRRMRYREIYIHSKMLLIDDTFISFGSANLNQRSMSVDSEINFATNDTRHATDLRRRIFSQLSGGNFDGKGGTQEDISQTYKAWTRLMLFNLQAKRDSEAMQGFLLPLWDNRSATYRLG
ncbi:phosphatidylserine/phosphatidylglycerophosphate/cardiolipin synthase family protein [Massilia sp.]|uniref:phospholipase D-like domain-containing protein n=1 Tax=Massilia sp. TaxID=1882437 RepID=UPI00352F6AA9